MQPVIKSGRLTSGLELGKGYIIHYGELGFGSALCGAKPGKRSASGFVDVNQSVTCEKCLKKIKVSQ